MALLVPLVVAPLLFLGSIAYTQLKLSAMQRMFDDVGTRLERVHEAIDRTRRESEASLDMLGAGHPLQTFLAEGRADALAASLDRLRDASPDFEEFFVMDAAGRMLGHHDGRELHDGHNGDDAFAAQRDWFIGSSRELRAYVDDRHEQLVLQNALAVRRDDGSTQAYLLLSRRLDALTMVSRRTVLGSNGFFLVTNADGTVLAGQARHGFEALPADVDRAAWRSLVTDGDYRELPVNGEPHYAKGIQLPGDIRLYAVLPTAEVNASTRKFATAMFVITLLAIGLTSGTLLLALHHVVVLPIK